MDPRNNLKVSHSAHMSNRRHHATRAAHQEVKRPTGLGHFELPRSNPMDNANNEANFDWKFWLALLLPIAMDFVMGR